MIWKSKWLGAIDQQAISGINVDQDNRNNIAFPGNNEINIAA